MAVNAPLVVHPRRPLHKRRVTVPTPVRPLPRVRPPVVLQRERHRERRVADVAHVRLLARVTARVDAQGVPLRERSPAVLAHKRPLPGVRAGVVVQVVGLREGGGAAGHGAFERPFPRVRPQVPAQMVQLACLVVTLFARVTLVHGGATLGGLVTDDGRCGRLRALGRMRPAPQGIRGHHGHTAHTNMMDETNCTQARGGTRAGRAHTRATSHSLWQADLGELRRCGDAAAPRMQHHRSQLHTLRVCGGVEGEREGRQGRERPGDGACPRIGPTNAGRRLWGGDGGRDGGSRHFCHRERVVPVGGVRVNVQPPLWPSREIGQRGRNGWEHVNSR